MARVVLVRHGHPTLEGTDQAGWVLSGEGKKASRSLGEDPIWGSVRRVFTSPERKAEETARILGESRGLHVKVLEDLHEVRRPFETEGYDDKIRAFLKGRGPEGWETREAAKARIDRAMEEILREDGDVGAVSHALLLTLFLAGVSSTEPAFWLHHSIGFAEYAVYDSESAMLLQGFRRSKADSSRA